jgi:predicted nuclease of restriction endonuclease-like RecB superfamily
VREPEPVAAEGTLIFPDFAIQRCGDPTRRWLLEIVGFWTADYIEHKLRRLRAARLPRLILCLDADRDCGEHELPAEARVVRFRKRIDSEAVLAILTETR